MFWLPITLSLILIADVFIFRRMFAVSFDTVILLNTLEDELWHDAPTEIRKTINRCGHALRQFSYLALVGCVGLMLVSFLIVASYHADPYRSSMIIIICAIDTYGYFFLIRRLLIKLYARHYSPRLKADIHYLLTFSQH